MSVSKDLAIASGVLVLSISLLAFAFTASTQPDPNTQTASLTDTGMSDGPQSPADEPRAPPIDDYEEDEGETGFTLADVADDPVDTAGTNDGSGDAGSPLLAAVDTDTSGDSAGTGMSLADVVDDGETDGAASAHSPLGATAERIAAADTDATATAATGRRIETEVLSGPTETTQPARPAAAQPAAAATRTHTVQSGDTFQGISSQYFGTVHKWRVIADANDIGEYDLVPGMKLKIPGEAQPAASSGAPAATARAGSTAAAGTYTVKSGDSYYTIARDQLGDAARWRELQDLNNIDPYDLNVGTKLKLPASASVATPRASTASPSGTARVAGSTGALPAGAIYHTVRANEVLGDISSKYYGTSRRWRDIAAANAITDPTSLRVGQRIIVPDAGGAASTPSRASAPRANPTPSTTPTRSTTSAGNRGPGTWHTIAQGDTFQVISKKYFGTTTRHPEITAANPGIDSRRLKIGQKIWVPQATSSTATATSSSTSETPTRSSTSSVPPWRAAEEATNNGSGGSDADSPDWNNLP